MKSFTVLIMSILFVFIQTSLWAQDDLEEVSFSLFHNSCNSVVTFDNYAYLGGEFGLHVVDVSDPESPAFVNCLRGGGFMNIDVSEGSSEPRLYSASGSFLRIIDISDRANPIVAGEYQTDLGYIRNFDVEGEFAYVATESSYVYWDTFIEVIDVSDPASPSRLSHTSARPQVYTLDAVGAHVYTSFNADLNPTGMQIFDATIPQLIYPSGTLEFSYYTTWEAAPYENYVYIGSGDGILIVDINDLSNPFGIDPYPLHDFNHLTVFDHFLFAYGASAIYMLDIIEPTQPVLISEYDPGSTVYSLFLDANILYHSATGFSPRPVSGMNIVDYSDSYNPQLQARYEIPGEIMDVYISENFAYGGTRYTGMFPVDVSDPYNPRVGEHVNTESTVWDTFVSAQHAYLAALDDGLVIFDISVPGSPEFVGSYVASDATRSVFVEGEYAYLINAREGYYDFRVVIVDVSDRTNPIFVNAYEELYAPMHIKVVDSIAYISTIYSLEITDMSDPSLPVHLASHPYSERGYDLDIESNMVYVAGWPVGLQIFDVSSPDDPILVGEFDSFAASDVDVSNGFACLTNYYGVSLLDVSDPSEPIFISSYDEEVSKKEVLIDGEYVYVAAEDCIIILRITTTGLEEANTVFPQALSFLQNHPNPFNASTTINYSLPERSRIAVSIYNLLGQRVATIFEGVQQAGEHSLSWDASAFPSGVYLARLEAGGYSESVKMVLLK